MVNARFESLLPWLRIEPQDDPLGFRAGSDTADPSLVGTSFGLSDWRPPNSLQRPPWLEIEPQDDPPSFRTSPGIANSIPARPSFGLSNWRPPDSVQQPTGDNAVVSLGLSNWRPPHSPEQPSSIGFRMRSDGSIDEGRTGNAKPFDAGLPALGANPPLDRDMGQRPEFQSWWSQAFEARGRVRRRFRTASSLASRRRRT